MTHLHVHSIYSVYDGVSSPEQLVDEAVRQGAKALALTDHGAMGGLFRFQQAAKNKGIKPILGVEGYVVEELITMNGKKRVRTQNNHLIMLAKNKQGWENLCHLNYISNLDEEHFYYKPRNTFEEIFQYKEGIVVGSACLASIFSRSLLDGNTEKAENYFKRFVDEFGESFYAEIQMNELVSDQRKYNAFVIEMAKKYNVKVVLTGDVHYATKEGAITQNFMFSLRKEEESEGDDTYKCKSLFMQTVDDFKYFNKRWEYGYTDEQIEEWCHNSDLIAEQCNYEIPLGTGMKLPRFCFDEEAEFTKRAKDGLAKHFNCEYKDCPEEYRKQLEYEIQVLLKKGAYNYMLNLSSIIQWTKENGYSLGVSRGSAGGSLVNVCLGIASWAIDPLKHHLLFERFVSEQRLVSCTYKYYTGDWFITKNRNYNIEDLKKIVAEKVKQYPEYKERALKELRRAIWLDNEVSIYDEIMEVDCDDRYVLPFFLGRTEKVDLTKPLEIVQIKQGGSGGLDIDTDFEPAGKEAATKMLIEKYGQGHVLSVGTYGTLGLASAIKDILRKANVSFGESNAFCKELNDEISFEENMENYKNNFPELYEIYEKNKAYLDMTPRLVGSIRNCGRHAGGVVILQEPIWKFIPVVHTKDGIATAFTESGSAAELDELGVIKYDFLAITVLETISNAVDMINEELVKIEDDDGTILIVSRSYLDTHK